MAGFPPSRERQNDPTQIFHEPLLERRQRLEAALGTGTEDHHLKYLLGEVDQALARLNGGEFGICESCKDPIEEERLDSYPLTKVCLGCLDVNEQRALEYDLELASRIQDCLLPDRDLQHAGWQIHLNYQPLGSVGGDYGDLIPSPNSDDSLFFVFGDVSGKGVSAAMLMSHLQAVYRSLVASGAQLEQMMKQANRQFCFATPGSSFATIVGGELTNDGEVHLANAGHCPALLMRSGTVTELGSSGMPLGMFCDSRFSIDQFHMATDDYLFLFTDGLSEFVNRNELEYGVEGIRKVLENAVRNSASRLAAAVLEDIKNFAEGKDASDDMSVMVIRRM